MGRVLILTLIFYLIACQPVPGGDTAPAVFTPTLPLSGSETTFNSSRQFPSSLTVEMAKQGMAAVVDAPASIMGLPEVQLIIAKHTQLVRAAGLSFDYMAVKYAPADERWFLVLVKSDGTTIAGWLQIAILTSQSGAFWRTAHLGFAV